MAAAGGTDYLALPLEYGDGSVQGLSLVAEGAAGFSDRHLEIAEALRQPLAAALEPTAMRRSSASLLRTYLGDGPAEAVLKGAIRRGDRRRIEAAILFSDLRGFTALSERLEEAALFSGARPLFRGGGRGGARRARRRAQVPGRRRARDLPGRDRRQPGGRLRRRGPGGRARGRAAG